jgi:hypothetical protein
LLLNAFIAFICQSIAFKCLHRVMMHLRKHSTATAIVPAEG